MLKESDIAYENGDYWVLSLGDGQYEVYENGVTAARRCAQITFSNDHAKARECAIRECDRRAAMAPN